MEKIPTIFERDWNGDRSRVTNQKNPACSWVFDGEGTATRKLDGMCAAVINGELFRRREVKKGKIIPKGFVIVSHDTKTGKTVGWVPVGDDPTDRYFQEAWLCRIPDGTYELVGPKSQGNVENYEYHALVSHSDPRLIFVNQPPRDFDGLKDWMTGRDIEGIVFHHPDGRYAKIKLRDFGLKRKIC